MGFNIKDFVLSSLVDFVKVKAEELIEKTVTKTANVIGIIAAGLFILLAINLFTIFLGIGIAFYISELTGKTYLGFLVMAALYLLFGWFFWLLRKPLISNPLRKILLKTIKEKESK